MMTKAEALPFVAHYLDDAQGIRQAAFMPDLSRVRLVGWQCGFEPLFVAVWSYLPNTRLDAEEAEEIAADYLAEIKWFSGEPTPADYVL